MVRRREGKDSSYSARNSYCLGIWGNPLIYSVYDRQWLKLIMFVSNQIATVLVVLSFVGGKYRRMRYSSVTP